MVDRSVQVRLRLDIANWQANAARAQGQLAALDAGFERLDQRVQGFDRSLAANSRTLDAHRQGLADHARSANLASRETDVLVQRIAALNQNSSQGVGALRVFNQQQTQTSRTSRQAGDSINQLSGRIGLLFDGILTLGPAALPILSQLGPGLSGAALGALAVVTTAGSAVAAFQGLGDAVKAVDEYQLEPTAANLEKAEEAMRKLGPDARHFALEFQKAQPVLTQMRDAAAQGWFPGLTRSLEDLDKLEPIVSRILRETGQAGGLMAEETTASLASSRWRPFLRFLSVEAPTATITLTRAAGDAAHAVAGILMAADPGSDRFLDWLADGADRLDHGANSAEGADAVGDFMEYARVNGPKVSAFLGEVAGLGGALLRAWAPLGGPILDGLTTVLGLVEGIAESDLGTPILLGAAAWRVYARAAAAASAVQGRLATSSLRVQQAITPSRTQANAVSGLPAHLQGALLAPRPQDVAAARRAQMAAIGKGVGLAAGAGFLMSGASEDLGLTNTAMLTLIGTMAGPWGAAAGAAAGYALDAAAANNELTDSLEGVNGALQSGDLIAGRDALAAAAAELEGFTERVTPIKAEDDFWGGLFQTFDPAYMKNAVEDIFGKSDLQEGNEQYAERARQLRTMTEATAGLAEAMGTQIGPVDGSTRSLRELGDVLTKAQPAMEAAGVSAEQLQNAFAIRQSARAGNPIAQLQQEVLRANGEAFGQLATRTRESAEYMNSAAGKAEELRSAIRDLGDENKLTADKANDLRAALEQLMNPDLDAEAALDQLRAIQDEMRKMKAGAGFDSDTAKGRANNELTRSYAPAIQSRLAGMVAAADTVKEIDSLGPRLAKTLQRERDLFIESGVAADFSAKRMRQRADEIGLTPKMVRTVLDEVGFDPFAATVKALTRQLNGLPKNVRTAITDAGTIPKTRAEARALADQLELTGKPRQALMRLVDQASGKAKAANEVLDRAARNRDSRLNVSTNAGAVAAGARSAMNIPDTTAYINIIRRTTTVGGGEVTANPIRRAGGGQVFGPGGPRDDKVPALLSNREYVIPVASVDHYGVGLFDALRSRALPRFADGGTPDRRGDRRGGAGRDVMWSMFLLPDTLRGMRDALHDLKGTIRETDRDLAKANRTLERETALRDRMAEWRRTTGQSLSAGELAGNGLAGFDAALAANTNDTNAGGRALAAAQAKGLDGKLYEFLAASGDLNLLEQFATLSRSEIADRERRYAGLTAAQNEFGDAAVMERFSESLAHQSRDVERFSDAVERFEAASKAQDRRLKALESAIERATERGSEKGTRRGAAEHDRRRDSGVALQIRR